ncbi:MAG: Gfo/Idh/MocA family oxidoreductase [Nitrososphaerota archaeon]|nr:Gfo/Idh/MocA family oxidoreductase [Nitrososphaerota archaeon]
MQQGGVRIAVLGAGYWGTKLCREYAAIENSTGEVQLSYVVDFSESALEKIRKELEQPVYPSTSPTYSSDYQRVLDDPNVEAVHIALPNDLHYQIASEALRKGKHVLLEKPIATNSREAFKLARLAEELGLVLQVGHIFRFNNAIRTVKEVMRSGRLGRIFYANLSWATYMEPLPVGRDIVFDLAPHPVDILNYLLDEWPSRVDACGDSYIQKKENSEEVATVNLEYPDQVLAHLYLSWIHHGAKERKVNLICEKGTITCNALDQKIQLDYDHTSVEVPVFPFDISNIIADKSERPKDGVIGANNTIRDMEYHFIEQIRKRGPQMSSALVGARTVQVLEEITAAMRTRRKSMPMLSFQNGV